MEPRINYHQIGSEGIRAMSGLEDILLKCGLESSLLELIRLRASQINGCAYCIDMHTKDARAAGERVVQLVFCKLAGWRACCG